MQWFRKIGVWSVVAIVSTLMLEGCQTRQIPEPYGKTVKVTTAAEVGRIKIELPEAWGGELRCAQKQHACLLGAVEHEKSAVVLHRIDASGAKLLDRQPVGYHPDSAAWLSNELLAAAVEATSSIDIFKVDGQQRLVRIHQVKVGFSPRDVVLVQSGHGRYRMLATPYSGSEVVWIDWEEGKNHSTNVQRTTWCLSPWHPVRVDKFPGGNGWGVAVACLDDKRVIVVPGDAPLSAPKTLATFNAVARQTRPSPSGNWLYVALETGGRSARINMTSGEVQWIQASQDGPVAVSPLTDELVIWGNDQRLILQRLDGRAQVLETRTLPTSGFSTGLQLVDANGDGEIDVMVLNSSGKYSDLLYGPLWDRAVSQRQ